LRWSSRGDCHFSSPQEGNPWRQQVGWHIDLGGKAVHGEDSSGILTAAIADLGDTDTMAATRELRDTESCDRSKHAGCFYVVKEQSGFRSFSPSASERAHVNGCFRHSINQQRTRVLAEYICSIMASMFSFSF
jgi:hypothetical protein